MKRTGWDIFHPFVELFFLWLIIIHQWNTQTFNFIYCRVHISTTWGKPLWNIDARVLLIPQKVFVRINTKRKSWWDQNIAIIWANEYFLLILAARLCLEVSISCGASQLRQQWNKIKELCLTFSNSGHVSSVSSRCWRLLMRRMPPSFWKTAACD